MPRPLRTCVVVALCAAPLLSLATAGSGETIYVPRDHATIQGAIDASLPGDTIIVSAGTYEENLLITGAAHEGLQIYGTGEVVLQGQGTGPALSVKSAYDVAIHSMTIRSGGSGVLVSKSRHVTLDGLVVLGTAGDGVAIDRSVAVGLAMSLVADAGGDAVQITQSWTVSLDGNDLAGAAESGVEIVGADGVTLEANTVTDTVGDGVSVSASDDVSVCGNTISDCGESGIDCDGSSELVVDENVVDGTAEHAVVVTGTDGVVVYNNTIGGDPEGTIGGDAVRVEDSSRLDMEMNHVGGALGDGVYADVAGATITGNEFAGVGGIAVHVAEGASYAFVALNTVTSPEGSGIVVLGESNTVSDNDVFYAGHDGIEIRGGNNLAAGNDLVKPADDGLCVMNGTADAAVFVENNTVVRPGDDGVDLGATSSSAITGNSVTKARDNGFEVLTGSGNVFDANQAVRSRGFDLFEGLDASANTVSDTNKFKSANQRKKSKHRR